MRIRLLLFEVLSCITLILADELTEDRLYYFAYGSNILAKRMLINNKDAKLYGIAKLESYRLDFNLYIDPWKGAVATICEDPESIVWGRLWTLRVEDLHHLDEQEGVKEGFYFARNVSVTTPDGARITARTYIETHNPDKLEPGEVLPPERRPSITYLKVILLGAIESGLSLHYIGYLGTHFQSNAQLATKIRREELGPLFYD